jgi:integrase/recombinase XerD
VIGPDLRTVDVVDECLGWLTGIERSPNTVEAYARDLALFFTFLLERELDWQADVDVAVMGEFAAWARRPAANVVPLTEQAARRSVSTVNRMLTSLVGFYEFHGRRGNRLATELVVKTRYGRGG